MRSMLSKTKLVETARKVQRTICVYDSFALQQKGAKLLSAPYEEPRPPSMCDCKYGMDNLCKPTETGNGCPEMREVAAILEYMTEAEYRKIVARIERKNRAR